MTWRIDRNAVAVREARGSSILSRRLTVSGSLANPRDVGRDIPKRVSTTPTLSRSHLTPLSARPI
jgi:hypothetical protein